MDPDTLAAANDHSWIRIDPRCHLECLTVYKRVAVEGVRRLAA